MKITVAVCTWNRASLLNRTLANMRRLIIPDGIVWELLIIDNNSTDNTSQIVSSHLGFLPARRIFEPNQGLSRARNRAIDEATGDLILWTDDDVIVDQRWLISYVEAAKRWPDATFFGGEITPWYEKEPPDWVRDNLDLLQGVLVIRKLGEREREFCKKDRPFNLPFGANMAFRRDILIRQPFNANVGYVGHRKMIGDETWLLNLLHSEGFQGVWVPSAKVRHYIPLERTSVKFLYDYFYWYGRTLAQGEVQPLGPLLLGKPRPLIRRYLTQLVRAETARALGRTEWVAMMIEAATQKGRICEFGDRLKTDNKV